MSKSNDHIEPPDKINVIVIGGGQAGLATGYHLKLAGIPFIILDANSNTGDSWRARWDSLELFTPRPFSGLPGLEIADKFSYYPKKDEIADYFESYANTFELPIVRDAKVISVNRLGLDFLVKTTKYQVLAKQVIVAAGPYTQAFMPGCSGKLSKEVFQIHSSQYKNPSQINNRSVVIVGGGNSATQLAEEMFAAGKKVTLISAKMPWFLPKTILGISSYWWFYLSGILNASSKSMISKYVQEKGDGIIGTNALKLINKRSVKHIASRVLDASKNSLFLANGEEVSVDAVIWATGYKPSYSWLKVSDSLEVDETPIQNKGISPVPGLNWVGLPWQARMNSGIINGVGRDAKYIVQKINNKMNQTKG